MDRNLFCTGLELFNQGAFFEAHEVLEEVWRAAPKEEKSTLQGLVQLAVAFHHYSTGNRIGACSLLEKARGNLSGGGQTAGGIDTVPLLESISNWRRALEDGLAPPPLPRLNIPDARIALP